MPMTCKGMPFQSQDADELSAHHPSSRFNRTFMELKEVGDKASPDGELFQSHLYGIES